MSFAFDTLSSALEHLFDETKADEKITWRIRNLIGSMHEANHRENDAINKDSKVTAATFLLKAVLAGTDEDEENRSPQHLQQVECNLAHGTLVSALVLISASEKLSTVDEKIFYAILNLVKVMNYADYLRGDYINSEERVTADTLILKETMEEVTSLDKSSQHSN